MDGDEEHGEAEAEDDRLRGQHAEQGLPPDLHGVRVRVTHVRVRVKHVRVRVTHVRVRA